MALGPLRIAITDRIQKAWAWYAPDIKRMAYMPDHFSVPPAYLADPARPTMCTNSDGWTLMISDKYTYLVMCPTILTSHISDTLDLGAAPEGTALNNRVSKSLTFLHELFHVLDYAGTPDAKQVTLSDDWYMDA